MRKFILFLIRRRLGLKKYEGFRFVGQRSVSNWYFFGDEYVWKVRCRIGECMSLSNVSLNWLLSDKCKIKKINISCDAFDENVLIKERGLL